MEVDLPNTKRQKTTEQNNVSEHKINIDDITCKDDDIEEGGNKDLEQIEEEFTQLKEKFFADKIEAVKEEIESLENGTHQGFLNEVEQLKNKKKRKVILAEQWRNFQYQSITASYECEVKHAEDEFNTLVEETRARILKSLNKKKKELEEEKRDFILNDHHLPSENQRITTRTLRKRGTREVSESSSQTEVYKKLQGPEIHLALKADEIEKDFLAIQKVR